MALFSSMLRRPSYSLFSFVLRTVGSATTFHSRFSTVPNFGGEITRECSVPFRHFSAATATAMKPATDERVVGALESEIKVAEEDIENYKVGEVADGFPFEIVDNAGEQTIMLRREFDGEIIKVAVDIPNVSSTEDNDDEEENEDTGIPMVVSVSKGNEQELEFGLTAFSDEICVDSLSMRQPEDSEGSKRIAYEGPNFSDLDESFQKALQKYLEVRGIKSSITKFLQEYMRNKDFREYLMWLKNLKGFIEQ
ncbi:putative mitochondrial glycoprotein [Rosa chinensis]|uniref:Putative mitochondrial glycoprotein n=1 Tax=Rosa chinensis TaxID=74649 RepID=A0A2P6R9L8_ROSCH|nr:uncharacterized protein At2g39795, mitochondrial [Rosa chinensis]PRQ43130.1 putative mitochondrial glycoprotein [Rosa chinensis]